MTADEEKSRFTDTGTLSSVFRRFAMRTTLAAGILSAAGPSATADEGNKPKTVQQDRELGEVAVRAGGPLSMREKKRRSRIRDALLDQARHDLDSFEATSETGYSRELQALGSRLTGNLKDSHSTVHNKVVFVDPEKLDVALSLGFAPDAAVETLLSREKVRIPDKSLKEAGLKATSHYVSKFGADTYTQDPTAITNLKNPAAQACVVIPSSEHAVTVDIKGLSRQDQVDFTNRHESWHCLDSKYNLRHLDPEKVAAVKSGTLAAHVNDRTALEIYATVYRKEALADVGAVGDMIRAGKGLEVLDKVSAWRTSDKKDLQHFSAPVLAGLKEKINEIGLEKFRKLSDTDAQKLYFNVTDTVGMTAKSLQNFIRFSQAKPAERAAYAGRMQTDDDVARAMLLAGFLLQPPQANDKPGLGAGDKALAEQLQKWDADRLLDDKAFEMSKKITPETIIKAYNTLQEDLHRKMKEDPENKLYPLQATKLQQAFLTHARELDYVDTNASRGVDIVKAEPALKAFAEQPPAPAKKTAAKPVPADG
ncbi:MAG: hypothetical protein EPN97_07735 [Alphaproteobacteria bacterium]|nr:MAG: hypothetical protein EPN97_07735 [Alphaproteobacteria bacterium]